MTGRREVRRAPFSMFVDWMGIHGNCLNMFVHTRGFMRVTLARIETVRVGTVLFSSRIVIRALILQKRGVSVCDLENFLTFRDQMGESED